MLSNVKIHPKSVSLLYATVSISKYNVVIGQDNLGITVGTMKS